MITADFVRLVGVILLVALAFIGCPSQLRPCFLAVHDRQTQHDREAQVDAVLVDAVQVDAVLVDAVQVDAVQGDRSATPG